MEYPFPHCLAPRVVGLGSQRKMVNCGKCVACLNKKSDRNQRLCELEEKGTFSYTYFCTLTYFDSEIPRYELIKKDDNYYALKDHCKRSLTYGETLYEDDPIQISNKQISYLNKKVKLPHNNCISYLHYRDIQLFNKLFRKHLKKYTNAKFRFYATGEYGPDTLRAHWHLIYFFDRELPKEVNYNFILSLWKFGEKGGFSRCNGGAVAYASAYVNSGFSLPNLYHDAKISTKSRHSIKLGFEYCENEVFPAYYDNLEQEENRGTVVQTLYKSNGYTKHIPLDATHKSALFPKPFRYLAFERNKSLLQYRRIWSIYSQQFRELGLTSVKSLCDELWEYLFERYVQNRKRYNSFDNGFKAFMAEGFYMDNGRYHEMDLIANKDLVYRRMYNFLLWSKEYCKRSEANPNYWNNLVKFYDRLDYQNLLNQYHLQDWYFTRYDSSADIRPFYIDIFNLSALKQNLLYSSFSSFHSTKHHNKLKKKHINDLSGVLSPTVTKL